MFSKNIRKTSKFSTYRKSGGIWQWVMASSVLVAFAVIVGYSYMQKGNLDAEILNPPLISAQQTPIKTRAENPGGIDIPNQDKQVFDLLKVVDKSKLNAPVKPSKALNKTIIREIVSTKRYKISIPESEKFVAKPRYSPKLKNTGKWGVQLASFTDFTDAKTGLLRFKEMYPALVGGLKSELQRAAVHGKTYYRTRFVGINSRAQAGDICGALKSKQQGCLVIKR